MMHPPERGLPARGRRHRHGSSKAHTHARVTLYDAVCAYPSDENMLGSLSGLLDFFSIA